MPSKEKKEKKTVRKLVAGPDINILSEDKFTELETYVRGRVKALLPEVKKEAPVNMVDDVMREKIISEPNCPPNVIRLSEERPSVYDILCSEKRYNTQMIKMVIKHFNRIQSGKVKQRDGVYNCFKEMVPDSDRIIHDYQQEALREQGGSRGKSKANIQ